MTVAKPREKLLFFATPPHTCSYLSDRDATTVFADPSFPKDRRLYTLLSQNGFRRSGEHVYRPNCDGCQACVPVRVPVAQFRARRSQRRTWSRNQDVTITARDASFDPEHFSLYRRYINRRHTGGGMDNPTESQYLKFLTSPWADTSFYEFRLAERLVAIAVADRLTDALSAVYSFFEPELPERSLGVFAVLWQIEHARQLGLDWLYLGYWIEESPKMRYKRDYQPLQRLRNGNWTIED